MTDDDVVTVEESPSSTTQDVLGAFDALLSDADLVELADLLRDDEQLAEFGLALGFPPNLRRFTLERWLAEVARSEAATAALVRRLSSAGMPWAIVARAVAARRAAWLAQGGL